MYGVEYCCCLKAALRYDPCLFQLLELLEYKSLLAKKSNDVYLSTKYAKRIEEIFSDLKKRGENVRKLSP